MLDDRIGEKQRAGKQYTTQSHHTENQFEQIAI